MKRLFAIRHLVVLAVAAATTLMVSCFKDDIIELPSGKPSLPTASEYIAFNTDVKWAEEDAISRVESTRDRLGMRKLKSKDSDFSLPMGVYVEEGIHTTDVETRGAKISSLDEFQAWAKLYYESDTKAMSFFYNETFSGSGVDAQYSCNTKYYWPGVDTNLSFVTIGNTPDSGFEVVYDTENILPIGFSYTVPEDATKQKDIVVGATYKDDAITEKFPGNYGQSVDLKFAHVMAAINVKVGSLPSQGGQFESITFRNVYNGGTYNIANNTWARSGEKGDFVVSSTPFTPTTGQTVNAGENTLMMMPQQLPDDAIIEVVFKHSGSTTTTTLTASISKDADNTQAANLEWKQNMTTTYVISIDENFNLSVTPQGNVLDAHYIMTTATVDVTELADNQEWYLKVTADTVEGVAETASVQFTSDLNSFAADGYWTNLNVVGDTSTSARGTNTVKGNEKKKYDVTIFIPENISTGDRKITLEYGIVGNEGNAKKEYLYQKCPYWDTTNKWGWEKVDDQNKGTYGFAWTKVICYVTTYDLRTWGAYSQDDVKNMVRSILTSLGLPTTGIDATQSDYDANSFVTIDTYDSMKHAVGSLWYQSGTRIAVIIDYTKLDFENAMSTSDGLANTKAFFYGASMLAFENALLDVLKNDGSGDKFFRQLNDDEYNSGKFNFHNYTYNGSSAIFRDNGGGVDDASGILKYIIKKNAFDIVTTTTDTYTYTGIDMDANDIDWYLPAKDQYTGYDDFEFATGTATFNPAEFWSSTAAINQKAYPGKGDAIARTETRKVIVQRKVTNVPQAASVTVDNSSIAGGENGSTNNWLE